jgi:hypothetical protein
MLQEDATMNPAQHVSTLRQTHRAASSILPMMTATLTVAGAVLAAMEARTLRADNQRATDELTPADGGAAGARGQAAAVSVQRAPRLTVRAYIATLVGRMPLGIGLVLALVYLATSTGRVGLAIILTALVLLALYLTEKVARR